MLPRRRRVSRLTDHRLARDLRSSLSDLPSRASLPDALPAFGDLVDAAIEAGAKQRRALPALRQRPRRRRTTTLVLLIAVAGCLVIAYRWWSGRGHQPSWLVDAPDDSGNAPSESPSPWAVPTAEAQTTTWPMTEPQSTQRPIQADDVVAEAQPDSAAAQRTFSAPAPLQPRSSRISERVVDRPERGLGRGISAAMPSLPSIRNTVPGRFSPHLPK